ncbi:MAG: hypothetical protein WC865_05635 [Bacteroidales bacterium]
MCDVYGILSKIVRKTWLVIFILLLGCEPKVDLSADWQDITVIHGFLEDGAYPGFAVRISRAFMGDKPVADMAAEPDSTNYKEPMEVYIEEFYNNYAVTQLIPDRDTFEWEKKPGIFPRNGNIWYFSRLRTTPNKTYKLIVYFPERDKYVSATSHVVDRPRIYEPSNDGLIIYLADKSSFQIGYATVAYGAYYQISLIFNYVEAYNTYGKTAEEKSFQMDLPAKVITPPDLGSSSERITQSIPYHTIFGKLAEGIATDSTIKARYLKGVNIRLFISTEEYNLYYHSGFEFEFGSTRNRYTNVINGAGLFSSQGVKFIRNLIPDQVSMDSLAFGGITRKLKFSNEILTQ